MQSENARLRFSYFAALWCWAAFIHQMAWAERFPALIGQIYVLTTIFTLFRPSSLKRFTVFVVVSLLHTLYYMPDLPNHLIFECILNFNILIIIIFSYFFRKTNPLDPGLIYSRIAPLIRWSVVVLFLFAFLAKLNRDFFLPEYSCASKMMLDLVSNYPWINWRFSLRWAQVSSIWLTLIVEPLIPVLLVLPRTRNFTVIFALLFHLVMGLLPDKGIYSFSALSGVIYFFFLSDQAFSRMTGMVDRCLKFCQTILPNIFLQRLAIFLAIYGPQYINYQFLHFSRHGFFIWLAMYIFLSSIYVASMWKEGNGDQNLRNFLLPQPRIILILLFPLLLNGFAPYLGIKTQGSMTMFSNLRILGPQPNHLFMPESLKIYDRELIKILETDHPDFQKYVDEPLLMTKFEFRRLVNQLQEYSITLEYRGEVMTIMQNQFTSNLYEVNRRLSISEQKFLRFKDVDEGEHAICRW